MTTGALPYHEVGLSSRFNMCLVLVCGLFDLRLVWVICKHPFSEPLDGVQARRFLFAELRECLGEESRQVFIACLRAADKLAHAIPTRDNLWFDDSGERRLQKNLPTLLHKVDRLRELSQDRLGPIQDTTSPSDFSPLNRQ